MAEGNPQKYLIVVLLVAWTLVLCGLHGWWLAQYSGGVYQEDTAILGPAVDYLKQLDAYLKIYRHPEILPKEVRPRINLAWTWRNLVVAPYLRAFMIYPPIPSLAVAGAVGMFRGKDGAPYYPVFLYLPLIILGTYMLARRFASAGASAFAAMMLPLFPGWFYLQRQLYAACPMTVALLFVYVAWWWSEKLARPARAAVFGAAIGALMLVKHTASPFLLLPVAWTLYELARDLRDRRESLKGRAVGIASSLAAFLIAASLWYGPAKRHLLYTMGYQAERGVPPFELFYYPRLVFLMAGGIVALITGVLLAALLVRTLKPQAPSLKPQPSSPNPQSSIFNLQSSSLFFLLWAAIPLAVFSFLPVINMEVTLPIMPAVAIVLAASALRLFGRPRAYYILGAVVAILLASFWRSIPVMGLPFEQQLYEPHFAGTDRAFDDLIGRLRNLDAPDDPAIAFVPFADIYFGDKVFQYYAYKERYAFAVVPYWFDHLCGDVDPESEAPPRAVEELVGVIPRDKQFQYAVKHADVILVNLREKPLRDHERLCLLSQATKRLLDAQPFTEEFAWRGMLPFPGGSEIHIYQRTNGKAPPATDPFAPQGETHAPTHGGDTAAPIYGTQ